MLHLQRTDIVFPEAGGRLMDPVEEEGPYELKGFTPINDFPFC